MTPRVRAVSPERKRLALDLFIEFGVCEAARRTGINKGTISGWAKAAGLQSLSTWKNEHVAAAATAKAERLRAELKLEWLATALDLLKRRNEEHIDFKSGGVLGPVKVTFPTAPAAACQHYVTAAATALDKYRLENGEVTGREEVVTVDAVDREIAKLNAELARRGALDGGDTSHS